MPPHTHTLSDKDNLIVWIWLKVGIINVQLKKMIDWHYANVWSMEISFAEANVYIDDLCNKFVLHNAKECELRIINQKYDERNF